MRERQEQYPQLEVDLGKLQENLAALRERCQVSGIKLSGIVKGFCALPEAAKVYDRAGLDSIGSSRLEQLRTLRQAGIRTPLMMISACKVRSRCSGPPTRPPLGRGCATR